jgi:preprotein translocase subunit SecA
MAKAHFDPDKQPEEYQRWYETLQEAVRGRAEEVLARAGCTSSAPSGTRAAASTTSSAAARAVRATRGVALLPVARGRPDAHLRRRPDPGLMERLGMEEDVPIEHPLVTRAIENAQRRSRRATSTSARTCSSTTT